MEKTCAEYVKRWMGRRFWLERILRCYNFTEEQILAVHEKLHYRAPEQWQDREDVTHVLIGLGGLDRVTADRVAEQIALADWVEAKTLSRV